MPRVKGLKKKYMLSDFSKWVHTKMKEQGVSQEYLGLMIGISQPEFSRKLNNNLLKLSDAITIFKELEASDEEILKLIKM